MNNITLKYLVLLQNATAQEIEATGYSLDDRHLHFFKGREIVASFNMYSVVGWRVLPASVPEKQT